MFPHMHSSLVILLVNTAMSAAVPVDYQTYLNRMVYWWAGVKDVARSRFRVITQSIWRIECHLYTFLRAAATPWPAGHHNPQDTPLEPLSELPAIWVGLPNVW